MHGVWGVPGGSKLHLALGTIVFIIMGPISPPKIVPDLSLYIYTVYTSWTSEKSSKISSFYGIKFPEECPTFWLKVG